MSYAWNSYKYCHHFLALHPTAGLMRLALFLWTLQGYSFVAPSILFEEKTKLADMMSSHGVTTATAGLPTIAAVSRGEQCCWDLVLHPHLCSHSISLRASSSCCSMTSATHAVFTSLYACFLAPAASEYAMRLHSCIPLIVHAGLSLLTCVKADLAYLSCYSNLLFNCWDVSTGLTFQPRVWSLRRGVRSWLLLDMQVLTILVTVTDIMSILYHRCVLFLNDAVLLTLDWLIQFAFLSLCWTLKDARLQLYPCLLFVCLPQAMYSPCVPPGVCCQDHQPKVSHSPFWTWCPESNN